MNFSNIHRPEITFEEDHDSTVRWCATEVIHYNFMKLSETTNAEKWNKELDEDHRKLQLLFRYYLTVVPDSPTRPATHFKSDASEVEQAKDFHSLHPLVYFC